MEKMKVMTVRCAGEVFDLEVVHHLSLTLSSSLRIVSE